MGGAASKQAVAKATGAAAKAAATASAPQPARVVQTTLSREQIEQFSKATIRAPAINNTDVIRNPNATTQKSPPLMEMRQDLLKEMEKFQDFEHVTYLQQDAEGFRNTASSYRPRSSEPISLPTDRTANASSGTGIADKMEGRLTNRDMRFLLRLHYEDPETWDANALASHFGLPLSVLANILAHVGPPNVLRPLGPMEHPLGIWYTSPSEAAAMLTAFTPEYQTPSSLPAPASSGAPSISAQ